MLQVTIELSATTTPIRTAIGKAQKMSSNPMLSTQAHFRLRFFLAPRGIPCFSLKRS